VSHVRDHGLRCGCGKGCQGAQDRAEGYLTWVQNSVLEGELTRAQFERLKAEVREVIEESEDSVLFYLLRSADWMTRGAVGVRKGEPEWML
jgi:CRISPR-associated protein Cas2